MIPCFFFGILRIKLQSVHIIKINLFAAGLHRPEIFISSSLDPISKIQTIHMHIGLKSTENSAPVPVVGIPTYFQRENFCLKTLNNELELFLFLF